MAVYVDDAGIPAEVRNGSRVHRSQWSHLTADTQQELHEFASRLGLKRSYFQPGKPLGGKPSPFWHYDVTAGKRAQAIRLGARAVPWREMPGICRARDERAAHTGVHVVEHGSSELVAFISSAAQADRAAGLAWQTGDTGRALEYLRIARLLEPDQSALWDEREHRVLAAEAGRSAERPCNHPGAEHAGTARPYPQGWRCDARPPQVAYPVARDAAPVTASTGEACPCCGTPALASGREKCQACGALEAMAAVPPQAAEHADLSHGQPGQMCVLPGAGLQREAEAGS